MSNNYWEDEDEDQDNDTPLQGDDLLTYERTDLYDEDEDYEEEDLDHNEYDSFQIY